MAQIQGDLDFDSGNYILFLIKNDDGETTHRHMLEWKSSSKAFAKALRKAADWLEAHSDAAIKAEID